MALLLHFSGLSDPVLTFCSCIALKAKSREELQITQLEPRGKAKETPGEVLQTAHKGRGSPERAESSTPMPAMLSERQTASGAALHFHFAQV